MKLYVVGDEVVNTSRDDVGLNIPVSEVFYVPDSTVLWDFESGRPIPFSELGVTREASNQYESQVKLSLSDSGMGRVLEDLVTILIEKGVMAMDEFPEAVQTKIANRQAWRGDVE